MKTAAEWLLENNRGDWHQMGAYFSITDIERVQADVARAQRESDHEASFGRPGNLTPLGLAKFEIGGKALLSGSPPSADQRAQIDDWLKGWIACGERVRANPLVTDKVKREANAALAASPKPRGEE